jgi:hypothetical protein
MASRTTKTNKTTTASPTPTKTTTLLGMWLKTPIRYCVRVVRGPWPLARSVLHPPYFLNDFQTTSVYLPLQSLHVKISAASVSLLRRLALLEEAEALGGRGACQRFIERRGGSVCEGLGLESALRVRGGVCEARCTDVDHQGYRGLLCGGGEVLQPVEREGAALLSSVELEWAGM